MSAEGGADGTEASTTAEVPEATKRLLEQAAKIRAEVIYVQGCALGSSIYEILLTS